MWEHRNEIAHGKTIEETKAKEVAAAQAAITTAYEEYHKDPFHTPSHLRHLFIMKPLHHRLLQDIDSMQCWLRTYHEAKCTQQDSTCRQAEVARRFFQPKRTSQPPSRVQT
jgi:hypothetical protein